MRVGVPEAELPVQHVVERVHDPPGAVTEVEVDPDPLREVVELGDERVRIELLATLGGDEQGPARQVERRLGKRDEAREPGAVGGAGVRVGSGAGGVGAGHAGIVLAARPQAVRPSGREALPGRAVRRS